MIFKKKTSSPKRSLPNPQLLRAGNLVLKPYAISDWGAWVQAREETKELLTPWEPTWSDDVLTLPSFEKRVRYHLENWVSDRGYAFLTWDENLKHLLGGVALSRVIRGAEQSAIIGYWCNKNAMRQGHTYAAVMRVLDFAFHDLHLNRIQASCMMDNQASLNLLEKAGFQQEGIARDYLKIKGQWTDHSIWAKLKRD